MAQRTASEVAEMESDIILCRQEIDNLRTQLAITSSERDTLKIENALVSARAQEALIRATQLETIMSQVSMGLISGLQKMQRQKAADKQSRRIEQEAALRAETGDMPDSWRARLNMERKRFAEPAVQPRNLDDDCQAGQTDQAALDDVRPRIEHKRGDPRIPAVEMTAVEQETDASLRALAGEIAR